MSIKLRRYAPEDVDAFYEAVLETVDDAYPWLPWCHPGYEKKEAQGWIAMQPDFWNAGIEYGFLIIEEETEKILGAISIHSLHSLHKLGAIGYWVRSGCTKKGIATEAVKMIADFGFLSLQLNRLEILMAVDNIPSRRVAEKSGAFYEGIARQRLALHNAFVDAHVFSIVKSDIYPEVTFI